MFFSNFYFWNTSSYFYPGAETKLLLHTWSLSAEWQFYLLYPLALYGFAKNYGFQSIKFLVLSGLLISFAISVYASPKWISSSYYLLHTRGWEMLLGGGHISSILSLMLNGYTCLIMPA